MKVFALIAAVFMAAVSAKNNNLHAVFKQGAKSQSDVTACGTHASAQVPGRHQV